MRCAPCAGATPPTVLSGSTRSSRVGRLLPDTGIRRGLRQAGLLPVAAHMEVGHKSATRPSRRTGCSPGTSARSTRPGRTGGCSATAPAAATSTASPGPTSSDTRSSSTAASPDDPELADYWAWRRRKTPLPINLTAMRLYRAQDGRSRSARPRCSPPQTAPTLHATGSNGWPPLARRSMSSGTQPTRTPLHPVSSTSTATTTASHQGLLEPDARKPARPVVCPHGWLRGRPVNCVGGVMGRLTVTPSVSTCECQFASGTRSPKWILNASSATVQFRVRVHWGVAFCSAR